MKNLHPTLSSSKGDDFSHEGLDFESGEETDEKNAFKKWLTFVLTDVQNPFTNVFAHDDDEILVPDSDFTVHYPPLILL